MNRIKFALVLGLIFSCSGLLAQDTLPKFSVRYVGKDRVIIGWNNNYQMVKQISIQRSHDSLTNYKTILSVADPNAQQNGFADTKAPNDHMFYRLFVVLDRGMFYFTEAKKPVIDTVRRVTFKEQEVLEPIKTEPTPPVVKKPDVFVPSFYVFTNRDGYVYINLPDADKKKYRLKFYEEDESFLFEVKSIQETALTLDKANFLHAGWFRFELYDGEKLVEKHKFYLPRAF